MLERERIPINPDYVRKLKKIFENYLKRLLGLVMQILFTPTTATVLNGTGRVIIIDFIILEIKIKMLNFWTLSMSTEKFTMSLVS